MRCVSGYHRPRASSLRRRNAPERSITRAPASTSAGASSAAALSGSARNTTSASRASASGLDVSSGVIVPFQMRASAGRRRAAVAPDEVAAVMVTAGWRASRRSSSCPV